MNGLIVGNLIITVISVEKIHQKAIIHLLLKLNMNQIVYIFKPALWV